MYADSTPGRDASVGPISLMKSFSYSSKDSPSRISATIISIHIGCLLSHEPAGPLEGTLLAGPAEVGEETAAVDRLENLFDPARQASVIPGFLVKVDLLEGWRLGFDEDVVTDQCPVLVCSQSE